VRVLGGNDYLLGGFRHPALGGRMNLLHTLTTLRPLKGEKTSRMIRGESISFAASPKAEKSSFGDSFGLKTNRSSRLLQSASERGISPLAEPADPPKYEPYVSAPSCAFFFSAVLSVRTVSHAGRVITREARTRHHSRFSGDPPFRLTHPRFSISDRRD
jgi:hypothetical protein